MDEGKDIGKNDGIAPDAGGGVDIDPPFMGRPNPLGATIEIGEDAAETEGLLNEFGETPGAEERALAVEGDTNKTLGSRKLLAALKTELF